jgi:hypothetical protein
MYKETLDILMEDINDHDNIKETILKNQLEYHFLCKNEENRSVISNATVITRRVLSRFAINKIIGVQPVTDKKNPSIVSGGLKYDIDVCSRQLSTGYPNISKKDLETMNGLDIECEINQACTHEIETEIVNEFLGLISQYAPEIRATVKGIDLEEIDNISKTILDAAEEINANWIVTSPMVISLLQSSKNIDYIVSTEKHGTMGDIQLVGTVNNINLYFYSLWSSVDDNIVLIGSKDPDSEDTPIVYAPEIMIMVGDKIQRKGDFEKITPFMTRYGKFVNHSAVEDQYRKISVEFEK